jgi:hypothetical protein
MLMFIGNVIAVLLLLARMLRHSDGARTMLC